MKHGYILVLDLISILNDSKNIDTLERQKIRNIIIGDIDVFINDELIFSSNISKYKIVLRNDENELKMIYYLLHEILHIHFNHFTHHRCHKHQDCEIDRLYYDIMVESYIYDTFESLHPVFEIDNLNNLKQDFYKNYGNKPTSISDLNCKYCINYDKENCHEFIVNEYYGDNYVGMNKNRILSELEIILSNIYNKKCTSIIHRNYRKLKYLLGSKYKDKVTCYIVIDTSTSIKIDIIEDILKLITKYESKYIDIEIWCFSEHLYKYDGEIKYENSTNFKNVYHRFSSEENVIIISDLDFSYDDNQLLNISNFKVIDVCGLHMN